MLNLRVGIRTRYLINNSVKFFFRFKTNSPYLSGDSISSICDYEVPFPISDIQLVRKNISEADSIFVNGHNMKEFLEVSRDLLFGKAIFSGNSDQNFKDSTLFNNLSSNIFCQNSTINDLDNVRTLPIGIENIQLGRSGFKCLHKGLSQFKYHDRVLVPPMSPTNIARVQVVQHSKIHPEIFDLQAEYLPTRKYFKLLKDYKFIFACEGNGFDTHRLWEILYQNSFPVVLRSDWSDSLLWLDLPILAIERIQDLNQDLLREFYESNANFIAKETPQLWIPFWKNLIATKTRSGS